MNNSKTVGQMHSCGRRENRPKTWQHNLWPAVASAIALGLFLSTLQTHVNGSASAYANDVGEIQNALPRWGLIHHSGYPLYTAFGSAFVSGLRLGGVPPAAGASLFSAFWGAAAIGLLALLAEELGVSGPCAALGALLVATDTSVWVDASLAEVHTMTLSLTVATLLFALRFGRSGQRHDLLLLSLVFTNGVVHQRSVILIAPAVLVLVWPQLETLWRNLWASVLVGLAAPLTYLYLPLRVWTGAIWVFGSPGTWKGFWTLFFDNRAARVFDLSSDLTGWAVRIRTTVQVLSEDMLWPILILGLLAFLMLIWRGRWPEGLGLTLAWVPNVALVVLIWEGHVSDALLAAKLPVSVLAGAGLALLLQWLWCWHRPICVAAVIVMIGVCVMWGARVRPFVLSITRDSSVEPVISAAERIQPAPDGHQNTLAALWGRDYWALTYAQAYRGQLEGLNLVDHNAPFESIIADGDHLLVLGQTFYILPVSWWENRLGPVCLSSPAPGIVELRPVIRPTESDIPAGHAVDLGNGVIVRSANLERTSRNDLVLTVYWGKVADEVGDYSVAVHLVSEDPPRGPGDILAQADAVQPVDGWYPISMWQTGEIVRDTYLVRVPAGSRPHAVRVSLYRTDSEGRFVSTPWLSLPIPAD